MTDQSYNTCYKCDKSWKPLRAHHCSICNQCSIKMDHHCIFVLNCVGIQTHKAFLLFCMYQMIGILYGGSAFSLWIWRGHLLNILNLQTTLYFKGIILVLISIDTIVIVLFFMFTLRMFGLHLFLLIKNETTIELMERQEILENNTKIYLKPPGKYNLGYIANLRNAGLLG